MKRDLYALLVVVLIGWIATPAEAQIGVCNPPEGTSGFTRDGRSADCRDGSAAPCAGMMLGEGRVWLPCKLQETAPPVRCLPQTTAERWGACSSLLRGETTSMNQVVGVDPQRPPPAEGYPADSSWLIRDDIGPVTGMQLWRCTPAGWKVEGERCAERDPPPAPPKPVKPKRSGDAVIGTVPKAR